MRSRAESDGQRQDAGDRLHLLSGLAVDVDAVRLGGRERLTARGAGAKPVPLSRVLHGTQDNHTCGGRQGREGRRADRAGA